MATKAFKIPKLPNKSSRPKQSQTGLKLRPSPLCTVLERTFIRGVVTPTCSPPLNKPHPPQSSKSQPFPLPILPCPDIPVGGRLAHFVEQWRELTNNKWVLSIVQDCFRIPFKSTPPLSSVPISLSQSSTLLLEQEITDLLQKRAVERVQDPGTPCFYSRLFPVPKKNGKLRLVIDFLLLNQYIRKQQFKMETVKSVLQSILVHDWTVSIDLTDAYLHVPIHPRSRKYLWFMLEGLISQSYPLEWP